MIKIEMIEIPGKKYELGRTTVTQNLWWQVMHTQPWNGEDYVRAGYDYPAVCVSWEDAVEFCERLSQMEGKTYRLPTEAEWEYACLAGADTNYHFGDSSDKLGDYAWFYKNAELRDEKYAHQVAQKLHNQFGLYDMHGNVWEWCSDYGGGQENRVLRGGSWFDYAEFCYACFRNYSNPVSRDTSIGFRLARNLTEQLSEKVVSCAH